MSVLMYHDVVPLGAEDSSGFPGRDAALYKITPEAFRRHLESMKRIPHDEIPWPTLTFDDGGSSALVAADLLETYGFLGTFLITVNYIGTPGFLDETQIRELYSRGHTIGSHSCSHPLRMAHCSEKRLSDEWRQSRAVLSDILGEDVTTGSVPGGDYARCVAEAAARAGYKTLYTSEPTLKSQHVDHVTVHGRFTIQRWMGITTVHALAAGAAGPRLRQALTWRSKKLLKQVAGSWYLFLRRQMLGSDPSVRWGDQEQ